MPPQEPNNAWRDRFTEPTEDQLTEELVAAETGAEPFAELRNELRDTLELDEILGWNGIPWRWSFAFHTDKTQDPIAYLVPEPGRPQFCCRLPVDAADEIAASKPSRIVREGLARGSLVGSTLWTEWDLGPTTRAQDLAALVKVVVNHQANAR